MKHIHLEPLRGTSGREATAVTQQSIKELLAEEGVEMSDMPIMSSSVPNTPPPHVERVKDHMKLAPLSGTGQAEPTAVTHKTIAELLAEEGVDINDMPLMQADTQAPEPVDAAPDYDVIDDMADETLADAWDAPDVLADDATAAPKRSLLGRLFGG